MSTRLAFTAIPLDAGKLELGRDELSELGLDDSRVSRRHLGVQLRGSNWTIRDHGSTNGTCVDGRPLTGSETFAAPQVIRIGRTLLLPRAEIGDHALLGMQADAAAVVDPALRRVHEKIATIARASPNLMIHGAGEWNDWDGHDIGWYWGAGRASAVTGSSRRPTENSPTLALAPTPRSASLRGVGAVMAEHGTACVRRRKRERLSQRYRRLRDQLDSPARMIDDELGRGGDEAERRHDYDDDDDYEYRHCYTARDVEQRDHELRFERCLAALRLRLLCGQFSNPVLERRGPRAPLPVEAVRRPAPELERRLVEHLLTIDVDALDELLTADELRTLAEFDAGPLADQPTLAPMLALLRPFWLRDPASWTPAARGAIPHDTSLGLFDAGFVAETCGAPGTAASRLRALAENPGARSRDGGLIEHLLVAYPYPACLRNVWQHDDVPALAWMIASAQGGSLQRLCRLAAARGCPGEWPQLTNKLPGLLTQVPASLSLRDALVFAEVLQLGGTELEFTRLHSHFVGWSGAGGDDEQRELAFWRETVQWFARHRDAIPDRDTAPIMAWARHEHTEQARQDRRFRWSGRTPAAVLRAAQHYADELHRVALARRMQHALSWPSLELDARFELGGEQWSFTELTTSMALCHESARMHHCVHGYAVSCWQRRCAIVSVQRNGRPCLTIELRLPQGRPVQVRGHCNRPPVLVEQAAVNHWAGAYVAVSRASA